MKLFENPIFITQRRIVHRAGVLAAALIAGLIGLCLLLGFAGSSHSPFANHQPPADIGKEYYGWIVGLEIVVLVLGGFSRVSRAISEDRKAGLWDSNRLTPMRPGQILAGYWLGPALREFYMALVLAGFGFLIVLSAGLPLSLWLGTQLLIASTALFFGLLGILAGMVFLRSQGMLIFLLLLFTYPFTFMAPSRMITNFLLPTYGIGHLFRAVNPAPGSPPASPLDWLAPAQIFGISLSPVLLSLILQWLLAAFLWRALVRKTANPFQPLLLRWEAIGLFSLLLVVQHGLLWDLWLGKFPHIAGSNKGFPEGIPLLSVVHGGTLVIGLLLLGLASPLPERVRVESLRLGFKTVGAIFSGSAASLALALALIAGALMLTQFVFALATNWQVILVVFLNLTELFLVFALLLEFCRLRHGRRALGFIALWLFALCVLPFILAAVFASEAFAHFSLLAPGFFALADDSDLSWPRLYGTLVVHFGVVVLLFLNWRRQWQRLLGKAV